MGLKCNPKHGLERTKSRKVFLLCGFYSTTGEYQNGLMQAISRNEPTLVIDRLHTFTVMYLRTLCQDKGIAVKNDRNESYPIHSLMGSLSKHYSDNENIQSEFSKQTLKMSISLFEKYNDLRNKKSYAHDNEILSNAEACYAIRMVSATICFLHEIERDLLI